MTTPFDLGPKEQTILVVEDDPGVRSLIAESLEQRGYRVEGVGDVAGARSALRTRAYSLVLCDHGLPGESGLDLVGYANRVYPDLPVIMLTGYDEVTLARDAIRAGAVDFIGKPFTIDQLVRTIEQNRARVERDRERAAEFTSEVLRGTIRALVAAVDAKDPHTAQHSERVTRLALHLGTAIGLPAERLRLLEMAALLHDVGKIGVPDHVLQKPGPLDEAEWALVRQHPARGAEIVGRVGALAEVASIIRHHHERVDGTGYPDGLQGEAIPPFARIICLVDAYEAMTAARAYRPAKSSAVARQRIAESLGTQFDLRVGTLLLSLNDLP